MADFKEIILKSKQPEVEQPEVEQPEVEQPEVEQPEVEQPEVEQPEVEQPKVDLSELFDSELMSELFNNAIDWIVVSGLLFIAKQKNVIITRDELELPIEKKEKNKELLSTVVDKIKIPEKLIGTLLLTLAILSKYSESYKKINKKK